MATVTRSFNNIIEQFYQGNIIIHARVGADYDFLSEILNSAEPDVPFITPSEYTGFYRKNPKTDEIEYALTIEGMNVTLPVINISSVIYPIFEDINHALLDSKKAKEIFEVSSEEVKKLIIDVWGYDIVQDNILKLNHNTFKGLLTNNTKKSTALIEELLKYKTFDRERFEKHILIKEQIMPVAPECLFKTEDNVNIINLETPLWFLPKTGEPIKRKAANVNLNKLKGTLAKFYYSSKLNAIHELEIKDWSESSLYVYKNEPIDNWKISRGINLPSSCYIYRKVRLDLDMEDQI